MEVWAALLGAVIGGLITLVAQWWITPRVDARVRATERWEGDVLALGQLLTHDVAAARRAAWTTFAQWKMYWDIADDPEERQLIDPERLVGRAEEARMEAWAAAQVYYDLVHVRVRWLESRVEARDRASNLDWAQLIGSWLDYSGHMQRVTKLTSLSPTTRDEHERLWTEEWSHYDDFVDEVMRIARTIKPPAEPRTWGQRGRSARRRVTRFARRSKTPKVGPETTETAADTPAT